jgi:hypothetical protein
VTLWAPFAAVCAGGFSVALLLLDVPASLPVAVLALAGSIAILAAGPRRARRVMALAGVALSLAVLLRWLTWYLNSD